MHITKCLELWITKKILFLQNLKYLKFFYKFVEVNFTRYFTLKNGFQRTELDIRVHLLRSGSAQAAPEIANVSYT